MTDTQSKGYCFVIAPIGDDGSDTRARSDQILKHIIGPAAETCGYEPVRADKISEPGMITSQVIQHIVDDPMVIADLTGRNPNVFYELAVRHAIKRPVIQIIDAAETIPFDIAITRTIRLDHRNLDSALEAKEEIVRQLEASERAPQEIDTPISAALDLQSLRQSSNPLEKSNAEIISMLQELRSTIARMRMEQRIHPIATNIVGALIRVIERIREDLEIEDPMVIERLNWIRNNLVHADTLLEALAAELRVPRISNVPLRDAVDH